MLEQRYSIRLLTSVRDRNYQAAIKIYIQSIPSDVRTNTNEIALFVESPSDTFRKMFFFALLHQDEVIGYAQFAWLRKYRILFLDYIVFDKNYRLNSAFYPFMSILGIYFANENIDYDYFLTEIGMQNGGISVDEDSLFLRKVLNIEDFCAIEALYRQPELGVDRQETRLDAQLFIKTSSSIKQLTTQTYLGIVRELYYHHYLAWYKKILNENELVEYRKMLKSEYEHIRKAVKDANFIQLRDSIASACKYFNNSSCVAYGNTSALLPQIRKKKRKWPFSIIAVLITLTCSLLFYYLLTVLNISIESFSGVYAASTTLAIGVTAYYFKEKS